MRLTRGVLATERLPHIPSEIIEEVCNRGLYDESYKVRLAAAITITCLGIASQLAMEVVFDLLEHGEAEWRWRAARCLASNGAVTTSIVQELLNEYSSGTEDYRKQQAEMLLVTLSKQSGAPAVSASGRAVPQRAVALAWKLAGVTRQ